MDTIYIIGVIAASIGAGLMAVAKINMDNLRQWLVWATAEMEKDLGSGTGQLKLRKAYDLFVARFPWLARFISFGRFGKLVDQALASMKDMLLNNKNIREIVIGRPEEKEEAQ